ncbi:MAG: helix-turn-helix domain-containing protein [Labilithrix sp.]|nr:helix-turn-helix domain-containing protein [Labilithrix sp.]
MSSVVVISPDELAKLIDAAVKKALDGASVRRSDSWISIKATGLPPTTIRKLIKKGTIRAAKVGRELRVNAEDVHNYLVSASEAKADPEPEVIEAADTFEAARARARARRSA